MTGDSDLIKAARQSIHHFAKKKPILLCTFGGVCEATYLALKRRQSCLDFVSGERALYALLSS